MREKVAIANRNASLVYVIEAFSNASWILPIWILFFTRQLGLSVTSAIVLGMTRWVIMAICNVPTGAWADRFGRVKLYRIGQFFYMATYIPFLFTKNLEILIAAQVLGGLFGSMSIGVLEPLVKDGFDLTEQAKNRYKHFISTRTVILYASRLLAGIAGAWLYSKHPYGPYALETLMLFGAYTCSLFLRELRVANASAHTNRQHISEAAAYVWRHRYLRNFFATILLSVVAAESIWTALQPYFSFRTVPTQYFGFLFGVVALLSAAGAYLARKIPDSIDGATVNWYRCIGVVFGTLLMLVPNKLFVVLAIIPLGFTFGFSAPVTYSEIQKHSSSKYQSTVLSLESLLYQGVYVTASVLVGRYVDLFGTATMLHILSIQAFVSTLLIGAIVLAMRKTQTITTKHKVV